MQNVSQYDVVVVDDDDDDDEVFPHPSHCRRPTICVRFNSPVSRKNRNKANDV